MQTVSMVSNNLHNMAVITVTGDLEITSFDQLHKDVKVYLTQDAFDIIIARLSQYNQNHISTPRRKGTKVIEKMVKVWQKL